MPKRPRAAQSGRPVAGVDVLLEDPRPALQRAPGRPGTGGEVEAERVVGIVGGDHDVVEYAAARRQGPRPQRFRRRLVDRAPIVAKEPQVDFEAVGQPVFEAGERAAALRRRERQVVGRVVEAVGVAPRMVVVALARSGGIVGGQAHDAHIEGAVHECAGVRVREDDSALGREGAAVARAGVGERIAGLLVVGCAHRLLIDMAEMQRNGRSAAFAAKGKLETPRRAPVRIAAAVEFRREAFGASGNDVHHPGDGVRAVDRRRAVQRHFHALHHARRQRVQVRGAGNAATGRAVDPAQAVHQNQHPLRPQVPQIDLRRTCRHAPAIGGKAEVAAAVEARGEGRAGNRQGRQHVAQRLPANPPALGVEAEDQVFGFQGIAPDARAGDDDLFDHAAGRCHPRRIFRRGPGAATPEGGSHRTAQDVPQRLHGRR